MGKSSRKLNFAEIVKVVDLDPIIVPNADDGSFQFRIEILRKVGDLYPFSVRVWSLETLRVQPTFPQEDGEPTNDLADHEFFVIDFSEDWDGIRCATAEQALDQAMERIEARFARLL